MVIKGLLPDSLAGLFCDASFELLHHPGDRRGDLWSPVRTGLDDKQQMNMIRHDARSFDEYAWIYCVDFFYF